MKVTLIAQTVLSVDEAIRASGYQWQEHPDATGIDDLAEFAGRACYQSWKRPNPATATSKGYHEHTLSMGHFSIYEHASLTFYITGVSRSLTHELVRHRHLSFSQLSQRFVAEDQRDVEPVIPPAIAALPTRKAEDIVRDAFSFSMETYEALVETLTDKGLPRKQAREAARSVLLNAQETKIVVSGNIRAWREFVQKRNSPHADAEIRALAQEVLSILRSVAPNSVQDITD